MGCPVPVPQDVLSLGNPTLDYRQKRTPLPPKTCWQLKWMVPNLEVWNFITLKLSYLCSTLNFRRRDPFQNWPLHPLAVNMVGWFLIQLKMNLSVVQLFYLLALFWQKSSHALPALYPGSGLLKLVIDTELLHNKVTKVALTRIPIRITTVFPHVVSAGNILFWIWKFLQIQIVAAKVQFFTS